jgi:LemA protein
MYKKIILTLLLIYLSACGYNALQRQDEQIKASWAEVLNQYQRRSDLVPNLVNVVRGYAAHEKEVIEGVSNARSKVGQIQLPAEMLADEVAFKRFQKAQGELSGALSKLIAVSENYPQLKADGVFRDLQAQIEGTENRIAVARGRYGNAVKEFNVTVRSFPSNLTANYFGYTTKATFTVENEAEISKPPVVSFDK